MSLTHRQKTGVALAINASKIVSRFQKHMDGDLELTPTQIRAGEILLDRALPKLSAVEQTVIDPAASMSEEEILAQLVDLARKHPQIIRKLQAQIGPNGAVQTGKDDDHEVSKVA